MNMVLKTLPSSTFLHCKASVIHTPTVMSPSVALDLSATSVCVSECTICPLRSSLYAVIYAACEYITSTSRTHASHTINILHFIHVLKA